ncbi:hypothetical protein J5N97_004989 [Dioscorea zingiberensis]|uniref:RING-type E3 ubiquitin transferase n=1 Tax=Dioscorea zingiberensis TaxID=325984 RepID=A0A9D5D777_9LILI|nr:hypothetical protein J5N97_004971 [Dioscorea zingiberensis]KAJ0986633.1 hypothetical protein J5N97_004989 [Dioscorea zingiberensis]
MSGDSGSAFGHRSIIPSPPPSSPVGVDCNRYRSVEWSRLRVPMTITLIGFILLVIWHCDRHSVRHSQRHIMVTKNGLSKAILVSFPILLFDVVKKALPEGKCGHDCSVCLSEFESDDEVRLLTVCGHAFHPECIDTWLGRKKTCPVCRADLTEYPGEEILEALEAALSGRGKGGVEKGDVNLVVRIDQEDKERS